MITLAEARDRVTERLAETSGVFWTEEARNRAINDAVRLVATVTKGVVTNVQVPEDRITFTIPSGVGVAALAGINHMSASIRVGGELVRIPAVSTVEISKVSRNYLYPPGSTPRWLVVDEQNRSTRLAPSPKLPFPEWSISASLIPSPVQRDNDFLFLSVRGMDKYITPTILIACAYLLLQERFDGDAERFYQLGLQELTILGVDPTTIPPLQGGLGPKQVA